MPDTTALSNLREYYIKISKNFFEELEKGKSIDELQPLQDEIEKTLLQLDKLEKDRNPDDTSAN
jgi:hypothetical protein